MAGGAPEVDEVEGRFEARAAVGGGVAGLLGSWMGLGS